MGRILLQEYWFDIGIKKQHGKRLGYKFIYWAVRLEEAGCERYGFVVYCNRQ
jgi:hypothetical protein